MSRLEQFLVLFLGFFIFEIIYIRSNFFAGISIHPMTLIFSFLLYVALVGSYYSLTYIDKKKITVFLPLSFFILASFLLAGVAYLLSFTFDTSWDGQGYHQSAVIALGNNWNPVYEPYINFPQHLPSQVFAESYPSALWEIQASIYSLTGKINTAKIVNIAILLVSGTITYSLLRKIKIGRVVAAFLSSLIILQPVFLTQALTFMGDGFGYQLVIIAASSIILLCVSHKHSWAIATFIMAELLLVSTKFSHLPIALMLALLFTLVIINRFLNREYVFTRIWKVSLVLLIVTSLIFAYLPYARNQLAHGSLFFPTNIDDLMGSVTYNNAPLNIQNENRITLLFYGIFSKSQPLESGDPRNKENVAELKIPFTFSMEELSNSAALYNNRVGSGGPLFSGIITSALLLTLFLYIRAETKQERYAVYTSIFSFLIVVGISLTAPTPNLLRYVSYLQLIPFLLLIPLYVTFRHRYVKLICLTLFSCITLNVGLYGAAVFHKNYTDTVESNKQFHTMRTSGNLYEVKAQQFYSTYTILTEQNVPFRMASYLICPEINYLFASSTTTQYCIKEK